MGLDGIPGAPLDVYDCYIGATVLYGNATFFVEKKTKRPLGNEVTIGLLKKSIIPMFNSDRQFIVNMSSYVLIDISFHVRYGS